MPSNHSDTHHCITINTGECSAAGRCAEEMLQHRGLRAPRHRSRSCAQAKPIAPHAHQAAASFRLREWQMLLRRAQRRKGEKALLLPPALSNVNRRHDTNNIKLDHLSLFAAEKEGVSFYLGSTRLAGRREAEAQARE